MRVDDLWQTPGSEPGHREGRSTFLASALRSVRPLAPQRVAAPKPTLSRHGADLELGTLPRRRRLIFPC
jgi:hypothetical protein